MRISLLRLGAGILSLCLSTQLCVSTPLCAQTKFSSIIVSNGSTSTTLSESGGGLLLNTALTLKNPSDNSQLKLTLPTGGSTVNVTWPTSSGALLTSGANTYTTTQTFATTTAQGDALIASINAGSTKINALRLDVAGGGGGVSLSDPNTWTATQTLPVSAAQSSALLSSINFSANGSVLSVAKGGTGITSYNAGEMLVADGTASLTKIAANTSGSRKFLLQTGDGVSGNTPAWSTITSGDVSGLGSIASQAANNVTISGGAINNTTIGLSGETQGKFDQLTATSYINLPTGAELRMNGSAGTATYVLTSNGTGASPSWQPVSVSGTLAAGSGGTGNSSYTIGDILYASAGSTLSKLSTTTADYVLTSNGPGVAPSWKPAPSGSGAQLGTANTWTATQTLPVSVAQGNVLMSSINNSASSTSILTSKLAIGSGTSSNTLRYSGGALVEASNFTNNGTDLTLSTGKMTAKNFVASTALGETTTPAVGSHWKDNSIIAWGSISASGSINSQFGNFTISKSVTGTYVITLPTSLTVGIMTATIASNASGRMISNVFDGNTAFTVCTWSAAATKADADFQFIITGR